MKEDVFHFGKGAFSSYVRLLEGIPIPFFHERIGISLFDHSGHLNVDSLRNFITEDRRVAILRCYGLYTLHHKYSIIVDVP